MTVYNNIDTIKAAYDALGSAANAVAGVADLPKNAYSAKARDMGAGRYDTLTVSDAYRKAVADGYAADWQTNPEYDAASVLMGVAGGLNALPEVAFNSSLIEFIHDVNVSMTAVQMKMIDDTVGTYKGTNIYNRPAAGCFA